MDEDDQALLALQAEFLASNKSPSASVQYLNSHGAQQQHTREDIIGDRVTLDLESREIPRLPTSGVIKDIVEHEHEEASYLDSIQESMYSKPVPQPKRIDWRAKSRGTTHSRFAASRASERGRAGPSTKAVPSLQGQIDAENMEKLQSMSGAEIEAERAELLTTLDPDILAALQKRRSKTRKDTPAIQTSDFGPRFTSEMISAIPVVKSSANITSLAGAHATSGSGQEFATHSEMPTSKHESSEYTAVAEALQEESGPDEHIHTAACLTDVLQDTPSMIHFPHEAALLEPDPSSETFLEDLKKKYFPTLQHDPSTLSWMRNPTADEDLADYHQSQSSLMPAQIRFDFKGDLVAPRTSREIDSNIGLHHHADAPLAAGYTIPELAHLSRSSFPSQACMAMQTVGRVMYKIGKKYYGVSISGKLGSLIQKALIEQTLLERSGDKHLGISSYATEALWQANLGREGQVIEGQ